MADSKVTALTELTAVEGTDLLYVVDDPGGMPASKKILVHRLLAYGLATWINKSGVYVGPSLGVTSTSGNNIDNGYAAFVPYFLNRAFTFDLISIEVKNTGTSRGMKLGLYDTNYSYAIPRPGNVLADSGEISTDTSGTKTVALSPNLTIGPGLYWGGIFTNASTSIECATVAAAVLNAGAYGAQAYSLERAMSYPAGALASNPIGANVPDTIAKTPWMRLRIA